MKIFWENILRYPKFLITSLTGLIFIVFISFFKDLKINKSKQFFILIFSIFGIILFFNLFIIILNI